MDDRQAVLIVLGLIVSSATGFTIAKYMRLSDDAAILKTIQDSPEIVYGNVEVYPISSSASFNNHFPVGSYHAPEYYTVLIRSFSAYMLPRGSVPDSENRVIIGFVDWDLRCWMLVEMKASEAIV